jgi:gluconate 5-dehydrogenase
MFRYSSHKNKLRSDFMKNLFSIEGKKAVVIGGGGGIGQEIAKGLAFYGADVAIASRNMDGLKYVANQIEAEIGKKIRVYSVDVTDEQSIISLAEKTSAEMGDIQILVNAQGLNRKAVATEFPMSDWQAMFKVNVEGMMVACREFGKRMIAKNYGRIINISSIREIRGFNGDGKNAGYASTKGAVSMLTKSLAGEWGRYNVTVNSIGPIVTMSEMVKPILAANPGLEEKLIANIPMGRLGLVEDNVGPAVFLASDASAFITGQTIYTDGGCAAVI